MMTGSPLRRPTFYGRRKGRPLRARKADLMDRLLPSLEISLGDSKTLPLERFFGATRRSLWLEIGFGGGEHLAAQAMAHPEVDFIGCEPFVNGVASLLNHIESQQLKNIRIFPDDARLLLDALPEASLDRCFVLFSDPWPKVRHAERRFIGSQNLPRLRRVLKSGSELRLATDDGQLAGWMRVHMRAAAGFKLAYDTSQPPSDWAQTRYEGKAIRAGRKPVYLSYVRHEDGPRDGVPQN